jgi:electron transport complex protein RnfB
MAEDPRIAVVHRALPQTQCTRCGYPDCHAYAAAIVDDGAALNRCPPGGREGIVRLAAALGREATPEESAGIDASCGAEGERGIAVIDEAWCIGCTLCIKACPVDCIIGASKAMHVVIEAECTGCELCLPACPVDCIAMLGVTPGRSGWAAWSAADASAALERYEARQARLQRHGAEHAERLEAKAEHKLAHLGELTKQADEPAELARKRASIEAALARARARRGD